MTGMGYHLISNFNECDNNISYTFDNIKQFLNTVIIQCNLHKVNECCTIHNNTIICVMLLAESHISVHINNNNIALDVYCCSSQNDVYNVYNVCKEYFKPLNTKTQYIKR